MKKKALLLQDAFDEIATVKIEKKSSYGGNSRRFGYTIKIKELPYEDKEIWVSLNPYYNNRRFYIERVVDRT